MKEKDEIRIAEWLNNKGYGIDLTDQLWTEEYEWGEHKTRDIIELMDEYHNEQLLLLGVSRSAKVKVNEPFEIEETGEKFEARINNYIDDNGLWEKRIIIVRVD